MLVNQQLLTKNVIKIKGKQNGPTNNHSVGFGLQKYPVLLPLIETETNTNLGKHIFQSQ